MTKRRATLKTISLFLIVAFLHSDLCAAAALDGVPSAPLSPLQVIQNDPTRFEAPVDFAALKEVHRGNTGRFIIHVQDAHANLSGQQNLAATLDEIMTKYNVSLVLVEGGTRDDTLTPYKKIAPPDVWRRVAKKYLLQGLLSGEEYLNLTSDHAMKIVGIEDKALYMKSLDAYAKLADRREETLRYLTEVRVSLEKAKEKNYPASVLAYEKASRRSGEDFETGLSELFTLASSAGVEGTAGPNLRKLRSVVEREKTLDFNLANLEQAALLEEISRRGGGADLEKFFKKVAGTKAHKVSQWAYFQNTFFIAQEKSISVAPYTNLAAYIDYLKTFSEIDLETLIAEARVLENTVYKKLLPDRVPDVTRAVDRFASLLETAYRIQMTADDFEAFKKNAGDFTTPSLLAFLNRRLAEAGAFDSLVPYEASLEEGEEDLSGFYESVAERDHAFLRNTERILNEEKQSVAILISGGYHTGHLKKLFREKGYSYAVLAPNVTAETNQEKYEKVLLEPVKKEASVVQTTQGRSKASKSLSALEDDLLRLQEKSGIRTEAAVEAANGARWAQILADVTSDPRANRDLAADVVLGQLTAKAKSTPAGARLADEGEITEWVRQFSEQAEGFLEPQEIDQAKRVARRVRDWGLSDEAQIAAWIYLTHGKNLNALLSIPSNSRVNEIVRRVQAVLDIVYEPTFEGKLVKGTQTVEWQTDMIVKASEGDREAMILVFAEKLEALLDMGSIKENEAFVREVKHVFVPLANRLGREEDTSPLLRDEVARLETPDNFRSAEAEVMDITGMSKEEREQYLTRKRMEVIGYLTRNGLYRTDFRTIRTRIKSISSSMLKLDADKDELRRRELTDVFGLMLVPRDAERIHEVVTLIQNIPGYSVDTQRGVSGTVTYNIPKHGFEGYQIYLFGEDGRPLSVFIMTSENYELYYTGEKAHSQYAMQKETELKNQVFSANFKLTGNFEDDLQAAYRRLDGKIIVTVASEIKKGQIEYIPAELPEGATSADAAAHMAVDRLGKNYHGALNAETERREGGSLTLGAKRMEWSESSPLKNGMVLYLPASGSWRGTLSPTTLRGRLLMQGIDSRDIAGGWERLRGNREWIRDRNAFDRFAAGFAFEIGLRGSQELYAAYEKNLISGETIFKKAEEGGIAHLTQLWQQPVDTPEFRVRLEAFLGALARVRLSDVSDLFAAVGSGQFNPKEIVDMYARLMTDKKMKASQEGAIEDGIAKIRVAGTYDRPGVLLAISKAIREAGMNIRSFKSEGVVVLVTLRGAEPEKTNHLLRLLQSIPDVRMPEVSWLARTLSIAKTKIEQVVPDESGKLYDILQGLWALDPRINVKHIETKPKPNNEVLLVLDLEHPTEIKSARIRETIAHVVSNGNGHAGARLSDSRESLAALVGGEANLRYLDSMCVLVNPEGAPHTVLAPALGGDVSTVFALTDPSRVVTVDLIDFDPEKPLVDSALLEEYEKTKKTKGYAAGPTLRKGGNLYPFVMHELRRLGIAAEDVRVSRLSENPPVYSLSFSWKGKKREVIVAGGQDATNFDYARLFTLLGIQKIDAYVLKAGEYYVDWGDERFGEITQLVSETYLVDGGHLILDQPVRVAAYTGRFERVPIANPEGVLFGYESKKAGWSKFIGSGRDIGASVYRKIGSRSSFLSGADVVAILAKRGVAPGPRVGEILRHVTDEERQGLITSRPQALQRAEELAGADGARLATEAEDDIPFNDYLFVRMLSWHAKLRPLRPVVYTAAVFMVLMGTPLVVIPILLVVPDAFVALGTAWREMFFKMVFQPMPMIWTKKNSTLSAYDRQAMHEAWKRFYFMVSETARMDLKTGNLSSPSLAFAPTFKLVSESVFDRHRVVFSDQEKIQFLDLAETILSTYRPKLLIAQDVLRKSIRRDETSTAVLRAAFRAIRSLYFSGRTPMDENEIGDLEELIPKVADKISILQARIRVSSESAEKTEAELALEQAQALIRDARTLGWSSGPRFGIKWKAGTDGVKSDADVFQSLVLRYDEAGGQPDLSQLAAHLGDPLDVEVLHNTLDQLEISFLTKGVLIQTLRLMKTDSGGTGLVSLGHGKPKQENEQIEGERRDMRRWFREDLIPWLTQRGFSEMRVEVTDQAAVKFFQDIGFVTADRQTMSLRLFKTVREYLEEGVPPSIERVVDMDPIHGEVVLMRHGQSEDSDTVEGAEGGRFTGHRDVPLTAMGQTNAERAGSAFRNLFPDYTFDEAYSSDLQRASASAKFFLEGLSARRMPLYIHEALKERHYGALQGQNRTALVRTIARQLSALKMTVSDIRSAADELAKRWYEKPSGVISEAAVLEQMPMAEKVLATWRRDYEATPPADEFGASESLKAVEARVLPFYREEIHARAMQGKRVMVTSHSNALRAMAKDIFGLSVEEVGRFTVPLATPIRLRFNRNGSVHSVILVEPFAGSPDPNNLSDFVQMLENKKIPYEIRKENGAGARLAQRSDAQKLEWLESVWPELKSKSVDAWRSQVGPILPDQVSRLEAKKGASLISELLGPLDDLPFETKFLNHTAVYVTSLPAYPDHFFIGISFGGDLPITGEGFMGLVVRGDPRVGKSELLAYSVNYVDVKRREARFSFEAHAEISDPMMKTFIFTAANILHGWFGVRSFEYLPEAPKNKRDEEAFALWKAFASGSLDLSHREKLVQMLESMANESPRRFVAQWVYTPKDSDRMDLGHGIDDTSENALDAVKRINADLKFRGHSGLSEEEQKTLHIAIRNVFQHVLWSGTGNSMVVIFAEDADRLRTKPELSIYVMDSGVGMPVGRVIAGTHFTNFHADIPSQQSIHQNGASKDWFYASRGQRWDQEKREFTLPPATTPAGVLFGMKVDGYPSPTKKFNFRREAKPSEPGAETALSLKIEGGRADMRALLPQFDPAVLEINADVLENEANTLSMVVYGRTAGGKDRYVAALPLHKYAKNKNSVLIGHGFPKKPEEVEGPVWGAALRAWFLEGLEPWLASRGFEEVRLELVTEKQMRERSQKFFESIGYLPENGHMVKSLVAGARLSSYKPQKDSPFENLGMPDGSSETRFDLDAFVLWREMVAGNENLFRARQKLLNDTVPDTVFYSRPLGQRDAHLPEYGYGDDTLTNARNLLDQFQKFLQWKGKPLLSGEYEATLLAALQNMFKHVIWKGNDGWMVVLERDRGLLKSDPEFWIFLFDKGSGMQMANVIFDNHKYTAGSLYASKGLQWDPANGLLAASAETASEGAFFRLYVPPQGDSVGARLADELPPYAKENLDSDAIERMRRLDVVLESGEFTLDSLFSHFVYLAEKRDDIDARSIAYLTQTFMDSRDGVEHSWKTPAYQAEVEVWISQIYQGTEVDWIFEKERYQLDILKPYFYEIQRKVERQLERQRRDQPRAQAKPRRIGWYSSLATHFNSRYPRLSFNLFLMKSRILGRELFVGSDLRDTLSALQGSELMFADVREAILRLLGRQRFFIVSSDAEETLRKFLEDAGFIRQDGTVTTAKMKEAENLAWVSRTGMDLSYFEEGRLVTERLLEGFNSIQEEKIKRILNRVSETEAVAYRFSESEGYHQAGPQYSPGYVELRVSPDGEGKTLIYLPAGRLTGEEKKRFAIRESQFLGEIIALINAEIDRDPDLKGIEAILGGTTTIEILPKAANKANAMRALEKRFYANKRHSTIFVGDNLPDGNDAPAMEVADVGIQVGTKRQLGFTPEEGRRVLFSKKLAKDGGTAEYLSAIVRFAPKSGARLAHSESAAGSEQRLRIRKLIEESHRDLRKLEELLRKEYPKASIEINTEDGYLYANRNQLGDAGEVFYGELLDHLSMLPDFQLSGFHVLDHNFAVRRDEHYESMMEQNIINAEIAEKLDAITGRPRLYEELSQEERERFVLEPLIAKLSASDDTFIHIDHHYPLHVLASTSTAVLLVDLIRYLQKIQTNRSLELVHRLRGTFGILDHADADILLSHFLLTHPQFAVDEETAKLIRKTADFNEYLRKIDTPEDKARVKLLYNIVSAYEHEIESGKIRFSDVVDQLPGIVDFVEEFDVKPYLEVLGKPADFETAFLAAAPVLSNHARSNREKMWISAFANGVLDYVKDRVALEAKLTEALDEKGLFKETEEGVVPSGTLRKSGPTLIAYLEENDRPLGTVSIIRYFMDQPESQALEGIRAIVVTFVRDGKRFFRIRVLDKADKSFLALDEPDGVYDSLNRINSDYQADGKAKAGGIGGKGGFVQTSEEQLQTMIRDIATAVQGAVAKQFPDEAGARLAKRNGFQTPAFKVRPNDVLALSVKTNGQAVRRLLKFEWQEGETIQLSVRSYENPVEILSWISLSANNREAITVGGAQFLIRAENISLDHSRIIVQKPFGTFVRRHDRSGARLASERGYVNFILAYNRPLFFGEPTNLEDSYVLRLNTVDVASKKAQATLYRASADKAPLERIILDIGEENYFDYGAHEIIITPSYHPDGLHLAINKPRGVIFVDSWSHVQYRVRQNNALPSYRQKFAPDEIGQYYDAEIPLNFKRPIFIGKPSKLSESYVLKLQYASPHDKYVVLTLRAASQSKIAVSTIRLATSEQYYLRFDGYEVSVSLKSILQDSVGLVIHLPKGVIQIDDWKNFQRRIFSSGARLAGDNPYELDESTITRGFGYLEDVYRLSDELQNMGSEKKMLLIGVGRGVTAMEMALLYPKLNIVAVNKEKKLWDDQIAASRFRKYTAEQIREARSRIKVVDLDIEDAAAQKIKLGNQKFDFVVFETLVQLYLKDNLHTVQQLFNERVGNGGVFAFKFNSARREMKEVFSKHADLKREDGTYFKYLKTSDDRMNLDAIAAAHVFGARLADEQADTYRKLWLRFDESGHPDAHALLPPIDLSMRLKVDVNDADMVRFTVRYQNDSGEWFDLARPSFWIDPKNDAVVLIGAADPQRPEMISPAEWSVAMAEWFTEVLEPWFVERGFERMKAPVLKELSSIAFFESIGFHNTPDGMVKDLSGARLAEDRYLGPNRLPSLVAAKPSDLSKEDLALLVQAIKAQIAEKEAFPLEVQDKIATIEREGNRVYFLNLEGERLMENGLPLYFEPTAEELRGIAANVIIDQTLSTKVLAETDTVSISELMRRSEDAFKGMESLSADLASLSASGPMDFVFDLDLLPADAVVRAAYMNHLLVTLVSIQDKGIAENTFFRVKAQRHMERLEEFVSHALYVKLGERFATTATEGRPEIQFTLPDNLESGKAAIPAQVFEVGNELHLKAFIAFTLVAGRWNALESNRGKAVPSALIQAYRSFFAGRDIDEDEIGPALRRLLDGRADRALAWKFALPTVRPIGWSKLLQLFRNVERMVGQAA